MQQGALAHDPAQADEESADSHAVGDALDCLVQVVAAGHEGCTVTLQSGGVLAAAQALQVSHFLLLVILTCAAAQLHLLNSTGTDVPAHKIMHTCIHAPRSYSEVMSGGV